MIQIWGIDENNIYTGVSEFISTEDFNKQTMATLPLLVGHVKSLFNGTEWIEGATDEEIEQWENENKIEPSPSELEVLKQEKEELAQSVYNLTTIVELMLTGGIPE